MFDSPAVEALRTVRGPPEPGSAPHLAAEVRCPGRRLKHPLTLLLRTAGTLGLAIGAPLLLLLLLETGAWLFGVEPLAGRANREARHQLRSCRWDPGMIERCSKPRLAEQTRGRSSVFVLGGSSVYGHPGGEPRNIPHYLRSVLLRERPGEFEVRSLAYPCKDSIFLRGCAGRLLEIFPDFLVIYSGHNDFSGHRVRYPRLSIWIARYGWPLVKLEEWLGRFRFWTLFARSEDEPLLPRFDSGISPEKSAAANQVILEHYTENLTAIIERASERGTQIVLVTVVSNLHEYPNPREQWGLMLLAHAKAETPGPWLRHYAEGIRSYRAGRFEDSLRAFEMARDADPRSRAPGLLNARIRELAQAHDHVHLVDFEPQLSRMSLEAGIGCNHFGTAEYCDGVHINPRTSRLIGKAVAERVLELSPASAPARAGSAGE